MVPEDKRPRALYHYTSMDAALKIVESQTLLMSGRERLNDPFDCRVPFVHKGQIGAILENIKLANSQFVGGLPCRYRDKPEFLNLVNKFPKQMSTNPPGLDSVFEKYLEEWISGNLQIISSKLRELFEMPGYGPVVASFGVRGDNLSLWGHYGKSHSGVAIEFSFQPKKWEHDLQPVKYVQEEPNWFTAREWCDLFFQYDQTFKLIESGNFLLKSLTYKSLDWEKEQEFRLVRMKPDGYHASRPPITILPGEMTRVIIGLSADPILAGILTKICKSKGVPVARMQRAAEKFAVFAEPEPEPAN